MPSLRVKVDGAPAARVELPADVTVEEGFSRVLRAACVTEPCRAWLSLNKKVRRFTTRRSPFGFILQGNVYFTPFI
jgi:hypothetical protein